MVAVPIHAADDVFQQAINYVFTGSIDPQNGPEIIDRSACVVVMPDPKFNRYIRYYLSRFLMDNARISKIYSGPQSRYQLEVAGEEVVVEYLSPDKTTVVQGYKSAQIPLPGNIDRTQKALAIIFAEHCKTEKPKAPF
jgi:hypothetical protein